MRTAVFKLCPAHLPIPLRATYGLLCLCKMWLILFALPKMEQAFARQEAGASNAGLALQLGKHDGRVAINHVERVFSYGTLHGLENRIARPGQRTANDNHFGIEQIDKSSQVTAELLANVLNQFDAKQVFFQGSIDNVVERERGLVFHDLFGQQRLSTLLHALQQIAMQGHARYFGF